MRWIPVSASIDFSWLGCQPYEPMWKRLQQRAAVIADGGQSEVVWACEHQPVYTTGRRSIDNRLHTRLAAPLIHTDRGGETTFHGPGQIMFYPVVSLRRRRIAPREYVRLLEQSCIDMLAVLDVESGRRQGLPGVWMQEGKIAAIGLRISRGVAYHGMALNVDVDAKWFAAINACGTGMPSTNLAARLERSLRTDSLAETWADHFVCLLDKA